MGSRLIWALKGWGARKVVYTTLAGLVEIGQPFSIMSLDRAMRLIAKPVISGACQPCRAVAVLSYKPAPIREIPVGLREAGRRKDMANRFAAPRHVCLAVALLAFSLMAGARAEDAASPHEPQPAATPSGQKSGGASGHAAGAASPAEAEQHRLPPDSTTKQTLALPGRTLTFSATAGSIRLFDDKGEPQADIAYTAYKLDGADPAPRPVTFLFNGGPGAASAYLQLGAAGPWRLSINGDAAIPSASPDLEPNAETWLDFTDLVFIDPVDTGYSRFAASGEDVRKKFFSIDGDVSSIALTIRRWLENPTACCRPNISPAKVMAACADRRSSAICRSSRASG